MDCYWYRRVGVSYISELRHVYLFLEEIMCSLCVLNELLDPFSLHHGCCV